ncbi:MAG: hypothetical protein ACM3L9_00495 [Deltaproteobacteria bacterium]
MPNLTLNWTAHLQGSIPEPPNKRARTISARPVSSSLGGKNPPYRNSKAASHHEESHGKIMSDELRAAIRALQGGDDAYAQTAFAEIADMARREPGECATELSRALREEQAAGALRTPRLLTLLGLTREPIPECVPLCLDLLRALATTLSPLPTDAALGAAAIVARTRPRALLPDIAAMQAGSQAAQDIDRDVVQALRRLLAISSVFLRELPDSAVTNMARWLWCDCAAFDLMTLADFAGLQVEQSGADDPIVGLMIDLVERVPATEDQKRYAGQRLQEAGVGATVVEQLQATWRAIRVAPAPDPAAKAPPIADPEPPPPEPRVDEWLAAFAAGDGNGVELARIYIDQMFEDYQPPAALAWWVAVTVDGLPPRRRRTDVEWALVRIGNALRRHGESMTVLPPSLLRRWLDTPQLLDAMGTRIALDLLSRQQPGMVVQRYLHRAVAASSERHPEILMGGLWRALAAAEPAAVLLVASRWLAFGFGQSGFLELLLDLLIERARTWPALIDALEGSLGPTPGTPADVVDVARKLLDEFRHLPAERRQP